MDSIPSSISSRWTCFHRIKFLFLRFVCKLPTHANTYEHQFNVPSFIFININHCTVVLTPVPTAFIKMNFYIHVSTSSEEFVMVAIAVFINEACPSMIFYCRFDVLLVLPKYLVKFRITKQYQSLRGFKKLLQTSQAILLP